MVVSDAGLEKPGGSVHRSPAISSPGWDLVDPVYVEKMGPFGRISAVFKHLAVLIHFVDRFGRLGPFSRGPPRTGSPPLNSFLQACSDDIMLVQCTYQIATIQSSRRVVSDKFLIIL